MSTPSATEGALLFEQPFVKVPYENYRKVFRIGQKNIEREFQSALRSVSEENGTGIDSALERVRVLKRKLEDLQTTAGTPTLSVLHDRVTHLNLEQEQQEQERERWAETRLDRWIVDWNMRNGKEKTARMVAKEKGIERLVDLDLFMDIRRIETALRRRSCTEALAWCSENKSTLRKSENSLEFELRLQEFIELCRSSQPMLAIAYSKKHLLPWTSTHLSTIRTAHALLVFPPSTPCLPYKRLFSLSRWDDLIQQFRTSIYALNTLPSAPLLNLALYAGLSALKLHSCYNSDSRVVDCPLCEDGEGLGKLGEEVPYSHHANSVIVCRISGKIMDQDNMPMAFPNGRVYSYQALESMAREHNGTVTCPRTGYACSFDDLRKVFIS